MRWKNPDVVIEGIELRRFLFRDLLPGTIFLLSEDPKGDVYNKYFFPTRSGNNARCRKGKERSKRFSFSDETVVFVSVSSLERAEAIALERAKLKRS